MRRLRAIFGAHRLAVEVAGLVAALALGAGIGVAVWGPGGGTATVSATSVPPTSPPTSTTQPRRNGLRGRITAENGDTWTVMTVRGRAVTVTLTSSTKFGTATAPATQSQFTVGSPVAVVGTRSGGTLTATRVITPVHPLPSTSPSTTSAPSTTTAPSTTSAPPGATAAVASAGTLGPVGSFSATVTVAPSPVTGGPSTVPTGGEQDPPTTLLART